MKNSIICSLFFISLLGCLAPQGKDKYNPEAVELNNRAVELMQRLESDSALILLDKALELDGSYYVSNLNKLKIFLDTGMYQDALLESQLLIQKKPGLAEGWVTAGLLQEWFGNKQTANYYYRQGLELYDQRLSVPEKSADVFADRLNRAVVLLLLEYEQEGMDEFTGIKAEYPENNMIDSILYMRKWDYMRQIFDQNL